MKRSLLPLIASLFLALAAPSGSLAAAIENDTVWKTVAGSEILAQGGGILREGDTFYWYGRAFNNTFEVHCYSSTDLERWTFRGAVFRNDAVKNGKRIAGGWLGRPWVLRNAQTGKYVMLAEHNPGGVRNGIAFLTCDTPTGDFYWRSLNPTPDGTHRMGDMGAFQDADGAAYALFISDDTQENSHHKIGRLTGDYLAIDSIIYSCAGNVSGLREAMAAIRHTDGYYYLFASVTNGWYSSATYYKRATTMSGFPTTGGVGNGWNLVATDPYSEAKNSYNTQHDFILPISGSEQLSYIYCGDRWNNWQAAVGGAGKYAWFPLTIEGGVPKIHGHRKWTIEVATGRWAPVPSALANPGFEWDTMKNHPLRQSITGWRTEPAASSAADYVEALGDRTGAAFYRMTHYATSAYPVYTYQPAAGLLPGVYSLTAWVKSSGGQSACRMIARPAGGAERVLDIPAASDWTRVTIPDIEVDGGECEVGFYSAASAKQWLNVDDVAFELVSPRSAAATPWVAMD